MIAVADCVELATFERSGEVESRHVGIAVLSDADGTIVESHGDPAALIYPRSSVKPLQATAVLRTGLKLDNEDLVLASASHAGTPAHVQIVERMLSSAGLDEGALQCPAEWPLDSAARREAHEPRRLSMNCSGKHAAFLAASVHAGWDPASYLSPKHPLQQAIRATIEEFTGERVAHWGVDGCHAPTPVLSVRALARATAQLAASDSPLPPAILAHPWAIDGIGRENAVTIAATGLIAKVGAEGVLVVATVTGHAVAVKMLDGSDRARTLVALELLARNGLVARARAEAVITAVVNPSLRVAF